MMTGMEAGWQARGELVRGFPFPSRRGAASDQRCIASTHYLLQTALLFGYIYKLLVLESV